MNREAFLSRVRQAAAVGRRYQLHVEPVPSGTGYVGAPVDICDALAAEVAYVGGEPQVVADWDAARDSVSRLLGQYHVRSALCWQHPVLDRLRLSELLQQHGVAELNYANLASQPAVQRKDAILAADIGITSADFAIAETGTLAVCARAGQERLSSLVVPVHVAIVARDQILPDLFDLFAKFIESGQELPSNLALISGPSKTGDIELELTTGIHGPGKWHVVIVRQQ